MHWHLRDHALRLVHLVIFAALALRGWRKRTCSAVHQSSVSIAQRWSLARAPPSQQPRPQRGKQPRPPRTVAVVLADDCSDINPLDQLAAVLTWCGGKSPMSGVQMTWSLQNSTHVLLMSACRCLRRDIQALLVYHPQGATSCPLALDAVPINICVHLLETILSRKILAHKQTNPRKHAGVGVGQLQTLSSLISSSFPGVATQVPQSSHITILSHSSAVLALPIMCMLSFWLQIAKQAGFGEPCSKCQGSSECRANASVDSSWRARVHMLDASDACWPLVRAACDVEQQQCSALESSLHPTTALHSQITRAAGRAAAAEPDIVLVSAPVHCVHDALAVASTPGASQENVLTQHRLSNCVQFMPASDV